MLLTRKAPKTHELLLVGSITQKTGRGSTCEANPNINIIRDFSFSLMKLFT